MASAGSKAGMGAIQGAGAGAAFGPWGAAIGAVAGGIGGYLQGDDPTAPNYVPAPMPVAPGGSSSQYGGSQFDPVTGRVIYTDNTVNGYDQASNYQRQLMMQQMLGGNGAQIGMDSQIQQARAYLQQLQAQGSKASAPTAIPAEFRALQKYLDADGNLPDLNDTAALFRSNKPNEKALVNEFYAQGGHYGGTGELGFSKWVRDAYKNSLKPQFDAWQKTKDVQSGNADTNAQAIQAAQARLDNLLKVQASGEQTGADFAKNPLMNFLNRRNSSPDAPDYAAQYADPNIQTMQDTFTKYLGKADENVDSTAFKIAGGTDPGMPDAQAANARLLNAAMMGGAGGERIAGPGAYDGSRLGAYLNNMNRTAANDFQARDKYQQSMDARRGVMGGSDIRRMAGQQALENVLSANAAQGYGLDAADRATNWNQNFQAASHNSDVAKTAAQFNLNAINQGFGNELAAKQFYNQMQQQAWQNNEGLKQTNFNNAMTSLNQHTGLQNNLNANVRYEEGQDQQNFQNRMGLLGFLQGADQQSYNQGMGNSQMTLGQAQLGFGVSQGAANNTNSWGASNAAGQNAQNLARQGQQQADSAGWMNAIGQAAQGFGSAYNSGGWGGTPATASAPLNYDTSPGVVGTSTGTGVGQARNFNSTPYAAPTVAPSPLFK